MKGGMPAACPLVAEDGGAPSLATSGVARWPPQQWGGSLATLAVGGLLAGSRGGSRPPQVTPRLRAATPMSKGWPEGHPLIRLMGGFQATPTIGVAGKPPKGCWGWRSAIPGHQWAGCRQPPTKGWLPATPLSFFFSFLIFF
jgi:hypothetical protein